MSDSKTQDVPFEKALADLEAVVRDLEEGRLGLEDALARYEAGVALIRRCQSALAHAEQRIQLLASVDADGAAVLQPFRHEATAAKARRRAE